MNSFTVEGVLQDFDLHRLLDSTADACWILLECVHGRIMITPVHIQSYSVPFACKRPRLMAV